MIKVRTQLSGLALFQICQKKMRGACLSAFRINVKYGYLKDSQGTKRENKNQQ